MHTNQVTLCTYNTDHQIKKQNNPKTLVLFCGSCICMGKQCTYETRKSMNGLTIKDFSLPFHMLFCLKLYETLACGRYCSFIYETCKNMNGLTIKDFSLPFHIFFLSKIVWNKCGRYCSFVTTLSRPKYICGRSSLINLFSAHFEQFTNLEARFRWENGRFLLEGKSTLLLLTRDGTHPPSRC